MTYNILIIDDEENMHLIASNVLGDEFELLKAHDSQEAIDLLSREKVHLILSDIHMPGLNGLEFLKSFKTDEEKKHIPFLIMTNLPSVDKEREAYNLGAADFIDKSLFVMDEESARERVRMKLVSNIAEVNVTDDLFAKKNQFVSNILEAAIQKGFNETAAVLTNDLIDQFTVNYASMLQKIPDSWKLLCESGNPELTFDACGVSAEPGYGSLVKNREPYFTNNIMQSDVGFFRESSSEHHLMAEIGVPIFAVDERELLLNNLRIPDNASLFAIVIIKSNQLITTQEFEIMSRLVMQSGSILWRLSKK